MLVRERLYRLAAEVPPLRTHNVHRLARFVQQSLLARNASNMPTMRAISCAYKATLDLRRSYATATRAKKATTPTKTVKKAVKAKAATRSTAKKAAPKKKAAPAKKRARKTVAKKKVTKKKAVPKRRAKKVLSPEEKERKAITELRKKALKEPVGHTQVSGFNAYVADLAKGAKQGESVTQKLTEAARKWKTLTPAEHEHYNHIANEKTQAKRAEYQAWIRSHTPDEIRIANNARRLLRRKMQGTLKSKKHPAYTAKLIDARQAKAALSPYVIFSKSRWASGDFKGIKASDVAKLVAKEWKALSAGEKKKYEDEARTEKTRAAR